MRRVAKPGYLLRPDHLARRAWRRLRNEDEPLITLPWGVPLRVPRDHVGSGIIRSSVYEPAVSEAMWRLTDDTDVVADIGANFGYFTALLASRAAEVHAFEPHPLVARWLRANAALWPGDRVVVHEVALSDRNGRSALSEPEGFHLNQGVASLARDQAPVTNSWDVATARLDAVLPDVSLGVLKLDVEGHEEEVLRGATDLLEAGLVRDILFEELQLLPSPVSDELARLGYEIFSLHEGWKGVELNAPEVPARSWYAPTYLATLDPARARALIRPDGWRFLRRQRR